jgi:hypothetical protein
VLRGGVGRFSQASYITGGQNGFSRTTSDAFDTLNNTDPASANFGRVTPSQLNQSRSIELAGKLFF